MTHGNQKFEASLKAKGKEDVFDNMSDSELISMGKVSPEFIKDGKLDPIKRDEVIYKIKLGLIPTNDPDIKEGHCRRI